MKKMLLTLAALPLAAISVPASAQTNVSSGANVQNRIANLEGQLYAGLQQGAFDQRDGNALRQQVRELRRLERQYSANGLTSAERSILQQRIRSIRQQMQSADNRAGYDSDDHAYGAAYGSGVTYDQYGRQVATGGVAYDQYGRQVATGGVAYDQYGRQVVTGGVVYDQYGRPVATSGVEYDRYGRPVADNGYYGQGGPYESYSAPRSNGLGNVLGSVLGGGGMLGNVLGGGGIGIGSIITGALSSVLRPAPSSYQSRYQNRGDVYFRSDGRQVYEIDARTNQVVRIHPIR